MVSGEVEARLYGTSGGCGWKGMEMGDVHEVIEQSCGYGSEDEQGKSNVEMVDFFLARGTHGARDTGRICKGEYMLKQWNVTSVNAVVS